jgi:hypothetical protein
MTLDVKNQILSLTFKAFMDIETINPTNIETTIFIAKLSSVEFS